MPPFPYVKRHSRIPVEQRGLIKLKAEAKAAAIEKAAQAEREGEDE